MQKRQTNDDDPFVEYRKKHPIRNQRFPSKSDIENKPITPGDGLFFLKSSEDECLYEILQQYFQCFDSDWPPLSHEPNRVLWDYEAPGKKFIWAIADDGFRLAVEKRLKGWDGIFCASIDLNVLGPSERRRHLAHTNLVGGSEAYCGGELWFLRVGNGGGQEKIVVVLNGSSGRFPPFHPNDNNRELGVVEALKALYPLDSDQDELGTVVKIFLGLGFEACYIRFDAEANIWNRYPRVADIRFP